MELGPQTQLVLEVAVAMLLGAVAGLDRELARKPAGLRTNMLVAGASAMLVGLAEVLVLDFAGQVEADPIRVIQAIIIGISFIGAGTIFQRERHAQVEGLTTAATLLISAGIGIAAAMRQFGFAIVVALLTLAVLRLLKLPEPGRSDRDRD